jgi:hypothetical protein
MWLRICPCCGKRFGNLKGKPIKCFCSDCLRILRNQKWIVKWAKDKQKRALLKSRE